jgi:hypothetical protein
MAISFVSAEKRAYQGRMTALCQVLYDGACALGLLLTLSGVAVGNPPLPVRITYASDHTCATASDFREAVRRRAPELEDAGVGEAAREFVAEVSLRADGTAGGKVTISEPSGATVTRRLEGNDCGEVTEALAFIVAELGRAIRIEVEDETGVPQMGEARVSPRGEPAAPPDRAESKANAEKAKPPTEPMARVRWEAGVAVHAVLAPTPDWVLARLAYLELGWAADGTSAVVSGRLSALYAASGTIQGTVGDAEIRWWVARAELCGPRFAFGVTAASGCATFDAGVIEGRGSRAELPKTERALWLSPGLTVRGHLTLEQTLVLGLEGGAFVPQIRPRFYFAGPGSDSETIHDVPWVGFRAGFGLGVLFP